jgi:hypothetical protein
MKEEQPSILPTHSCSHPCIFQESRGPDPSFPLGLTRGYWTRWAEIIADLAVGVLLTALSAVSRGGVSILFYAILFHLFYF